MTHQVEIGTTGNAPPELREQLESALTAADRGVTQMRIEQRSAELPDLISVFLIWTLVTATDELVRQVVRDSVAAFKEARRHYPIQGNIRLDGLSAPLEYWLGANVPDEALDLIEFRRPHAALRP